MTRRGRFILSSSAEKSSKTRPKVGLALGGGGARGYAHIGVIRVLERHGIPIDAIVGTSMGAVIGGAYAAGIDLGKLEELLKALDLNRMLGIPHSSILKLVGNITSEYLFKRLDWRERDLASTQALIEFFDLFTKRQAFDELALPFAVVAVDIDTGEAVVLREGSVSRALAAGVAIPGVHYPVKIDGRYLVDGGLLNRVPADVAFERLGVDLVIAVDVSADLFCPRAITSLEVLFQAESIVLRELTRLRLDALERRLEKRLIVLRPPVQHIRTFDLSELDEPVRAGEEEAVRHVSLIQERIACLARV